MQNFFQTILSLLVLSFGVQSLTNTTITFWSDRNGKGKSEKYTGLNIRRKCTLVPELKFEMRSITTNTCIQFFPTKNCGGATVHQIGSSTVNLAPNGQKVQSWIPCRQRDLNVTIFNSSNADERPLVKFINLCKCVNIPDELQQIVIYVDTGEQEIFLYAKENCTGRYVSSYGGNIHKISLEPSSRPPSCPFLTGVLTEISNFVPTKDPKITQVPLQVTPTEIQSPRKQVVSVTFAGEDTKYLTVSAFPWRRHLLSCDLKGEIILKEKLPLSTWENETKFQNDFVESHCKARDSIDGYYADRTKKMNKTFVETRNISIASGVTTNFYALRSYKTKYFDYKILLNISGISIDTEIISADDLENLLPQSGLRFVRKLDTFTVMAEAKASLKSQYPFSTKYWTEVKDPFF